MPSSLWEKNEEDTIPAHNNQQGIIILTSTGSLEPLDITSLNVRSNQTTHADTGSAI